MKHACEFHCYVGRKGSGKSASLMEDICDTIVQTDMQVVGNPPVKWDGLETFLADKYEWRGDVFSRLTLDDNLYRLQRFYCNFGQGWFVPYVTDEEYKRGVRVDFRLAYRYVPRAGATGRLSVEDLSIQEIRALLESGDMESKSTKDLPRVMHALDEIGKLYRAREMHKVIPGLEDYLDQQRHLSQEVVATTVRVDKIAPVVREMVDRWYVMTNLGKKRKSWFRGPLVLTGTEFDEIPGGTVKPVHTVWRKLDIEGLCKTYDTTSVVDGMEGDKGKTVKGLPWWVAVGCGVVLLCLLPLLLQGCQKGFKAASNRVLHGGGGSVSSAATNLAAGATAGFKPQVSLSTNISRERREEKRPRMTGIIAFNGRAKALFDDGSEIGHTDPRWRGLIKDGKRAVGVMFIWGPEYVKGEAHPVEDGPWRFRRPVYQ